MRQDRVEVPSIKSWLQRQSRVAGRQRKLSRTLVDAAVGQPLEIIDEAFAGFTRVDAGTPRVDVNSQCTTNGAHDVPERMIDRDILVTLSMQLKALDEQREQLSRLLESADGLPA